MDAISSLSGAAASGTSGKTEAESKLTGLGEDYNNFLKLLTTQLQHQDPLEPMDTETFTQQIVAFSEVEQSIATNRNLEKLLTQQGNVALSQAVSYIGQTVEAATDKVMLADGKAEVAYTLPDRTAEASVVFLDGNDIPVYVAKLDPKAGRGTYSWDGKAATGATLPDGVFKARVTALDKDGAQLDAVIASRGKVTSIVNSDQGPAVMVGDLPIRLDEILAVSPATATADA